MRKTLLTASILFLLAMQVNAQLNVMKLVGNNTKDYTLGYGAFIETGVPVSEGADVTAELGFAIFFSKDYGTDYGTAMVPLKVGYRYTLNGTGLGMYVEPQVGYNLYGLTSLPNYSGDIELKYHGIVLAAGLGYLFELWRSPVDLNLRFETVRAHGGSNNLVSLGISRAFSFGKRNTDY